MHDGQAVGLLTRLRKVLFQYNGPADTVANLGGGSSVSHFVFNAEEQ